MIDFLNVFYLLLYFQYFKHLLSEAKIHLSRPASHHCWINYNNDVLYYKLNNYTREINTEI